MQVIYFGCQNTSIQWQGFCKFQLGRFADEQTGSGTLTPSRKVHKFFDSYPQYTHRPADLEANNFNLSPSLGQDSCGGTSSLLNIPVTNVVDSAHFGYVYCMTLIPSTGEGTRENAQKRVQNYYLVTGSGDETVKVCLNLDSGDASTDFLLFVALALQPIRSQHGSLFRLPARSCSFDRCFRGDNLRRMSRWTREGS
jgi:di- and tripeptidase